jgi:hypothetical protein
MGQSPGGTSPHPPRFARRPLPQAGEVTGRYATFTPHLRNSILAKPNGAGVNGPGGARVINATTPSATITANSGIASRLHSELAGGCVGLGGGVGAATAGDDGAIWPC